MTHVETKEKWYVVKCVPKCEEKACTSIIAAGVKAYLPQYKKDCIHQRTKKKVTKIFPLFQRYLFVRLPVTNPDWDAVRDSDGVDSILGRNGYYVPVPGKQIEALIAAQDDLQFDDTHAAKVHRGEILADRKAQFERTYSPGRSFTVNKGAFKGLSGHIDRLRSMSEVHAILTLLGGMVPVKISIEDIDIGDIDGNRKLA